MVVANYLSIEYENIIIKSLIVEHRMQSARGEKVLLKECKLRYLGLIYRFHLRNLDHFNNNISETDSFKLYNR